MLSLVKKETPFITNKRKLSLFTPPGLLAYKRGRKAGKYSNLFEKANKGWEHKHKNKWFGNTYQTIAASDWGRLNLSMNLCRAITRHIHHGIDKCNDKPDFTENKRYNIIGKETLAHTEHKCECL